MTQWRSTLRVTPRDVKLLVTDGEHGDLLKARLPSRPPHPRALLTLLEGLALWSGHPMSAVISAADCVPRGPTAVLFGDELWPGESPLVRFRFAAPGCRRRLAGLGDFRATRRLDPRGDRL
jgi:hypothetical protein